jgi:Uma2 family endonuclease
MSMPMQRLVAFDDYMAGEGLNDRKAEYIAGHVRVMTGGSISHARMIHALAMAIGPTAKSQGCETFTSDAMLRIGDTIAYYPDLMVCCDVDDDDGRFRTSPCLVIEVLSPSTRTTDKAEKVAVYELMASLRGFALVNPDEPWIEFHTRSSANQPWKRTTHGAGSSVFLPCPEGLVLNIDDLYG